MHRMGVLHPGQMGISVAAAAQNSGCEVVWASEGRSPQTHERARRFGLRDAGTLAGLCEVSSLIVSVCPPHAAEEVAHDVVEQRFNGIYLDANAIAPQRATRIGEVLNAAGVAFVDGGIIGGPAWEPGRTWLYLAGRDAAEVASCFAAGPLEVAVIGAEAGKASALKMCYAAYTKGTTALICAIRSTAEALDVWEELRAQWLRDWPDLPAQTEGRVRRVTAKAWRFAGEMDEIAATFQAAGLPGGFHAAAGEVYRRLAHYKDAPSIPELDAVLADLIRPSQGEGE